MLDTKGLVLDDSFVYITEESVEIIVSGCHSRQLVDYLGQYVVYVRLVKYVQYVQHVFYSMYSMYSVYSIYNMYSMYSMYSMYNI